VVSSCLALPEGAGWVGLALVRRAALAEIQLWSGDGQDGAGDACAPSGWRFELSLPELFEEPPVGAGGQGAAAGAARLA
jgi:hypothetical protein